MQLVGSAMRRRAIGQMVLVTLMWSIAGVVSRHLQAAQGFEVTFWRSAFTALTLGLVLPVVMGPRQLARAFRDGGLPLWLSGLCWSVMFTAFMLAMTMTRVAVVLVVLSIGPMVTALFARIFLHQRQPLRTWLAMVVAGAGMAWMFGAPMLQEGASAWRGTDALGALLALAVPLAAASNWTVLHAAHARAAREPHAVGPGQDDGPQARAREPVSMLPAVLIGAVLSSLVTWWPAQPMVATPRDLALLAVLGIVQLAIPCVMVVRLLKVLSTAQVSLIGLLEVIFGVLWAWMFAGEAPGLAAVQGGAVVLAALVVNEWLAMRRQRRGGDDAEAVPVGHA